nr:extracellular solute-binding protein [uncultured Blautia sp.]
MKKTSKKLLALALVLALLCLTGCGDGSGKSGGDSQAGDENTLTVWAWDSQFNLYSMEEAAKIYQKDHPDFKLNTVEITWDDLQTKLGTIIGSGDYSQPMSFT